MVQQNGDSELANPSVRIQIWVIVSKILCQAIGAFVDLFEHIGLDAKLVSYGPDRVATKLGYIAGNARGCDHLSVPVQFVFGVS